MVQGERGRDGRDRADELAPGAFGRRFAARRRWKTDPGIEVALGWMLEGWPSRRWLDLGAGGGAYVAWLRARDVSAQGIDGTPGIAEISGGLVAEGNLARPLAVPPADVVLSLEVGEHIPAALEAAYLDNLAGLAGELLVVSWAVPGQRGRGHINCREPAWVRGELERRGLVVLGTETELLRVLAGGGWQRKLWLLGRR